MSVKHSLIVTGVLCLLAAIIADDKNTSKFTRLTCAVYDKALIVNHTCSLRPISRNTTVINIRGTFAHQIHSILVHIQLFKKYTVYKPFLVDVMENYCHYFSKKSSTPYIAVLYNIAKQYLNLNHSCPYEAGELYFKGLHLEPGRVRGLWPVGEYRMDVSVLFNDSPTNTCKAQVFFEFGQKVFT